jgi:restriction system protein
MAVLGENDVGIALSTEGFTKNAREEALTKANRRVTLVDLERLLELWTEHYKTLDGEAKRRVPPEPFYFLAPHG